MTLFLILVVFTVILAFVPGLGLFAIVPGALALLYLGWLLLTTASGRTPGSAIRRGGRRPRLLGPGGPDDPDNTRT
jgi:hypothetical protein